LAPACRCLPAPSLEINTPVPSMTRSMFSAAHGSCVGSRDETILIGLPLTEMVESSTMRTSALKVPSVESYLSRWLACLTPPESLMTVTLSSDSGPRPSTQRRKLRPMRPKPLIATLIFFLATTSVRLPKVAWLRE